MDNSDAPLLHAVEVAAKSELVGAESPAGQRVVVQVQRCAERVVLLLGLVGQHSRELQLLVCGVRITLPVHGEVVGEQDCTEVTGASTTVT